MVILSFPMRDEALPLNEIDYFMHAMDDVQRSMTGRGNVCCLALELDATPAAAMQELERLTAVSPAVRWLSRLRLRGDGPFGGMSWIPRPEAAAEISEIGANAPIDAIVSSVDIRPRLDAPFRMALVRSERPLALFFWHHSALDAHGAEALIRRFCQGSGAEERARPVSSIPISRQLAEASAAKRWIFDRARAPLSAPLAPLVRRKGAHYTRLRFDTRETRGIDERCRALGMELFRSCVFLAAAAAAFRDLLDHRGLDRGAFLVPVPHDTRRSAKASAALSNQLSFLFYRIEPADLESVERAARSILDQAQEIVARDLGPACSSMLRLFSKLPLPLYQRLILAPSKGELASFCFSDTGDSLSKLGSLGAIPVTDAVHFPPNFYPPGLSFVFSRRGGELTLMIVSADGLLSEADRDLLAARARAHLLGGTPT